MNTDNITEITVQVNVNAPIQTVWDCWINPFHIVKWYFASDDWHAPFAENDLKLNGKFKTKMAAKDGSFGFDFEGTYTNIETHKLIEYILADDRKVKITFEQYDDFICVTETFDAETVNDIELQRGGWQAILDNFKKHVEQV